MKEFTDVGIFFGVGGEGRRLVHEVDDAVRLTVDDSAVEDIAVRGTDGVILGRIGQAADAGQALDGLVDDFGSCLFNLSR